MPASQQRILVTGSTGHLGSACARALACPGASILLHYRSSAGRAQELMREFKEKGARVQACAIDLCTAEGPQRLVEVCQEFMGGLDLFLHAAAIFEKTPLGTVLETQWQRIVDTNLTAAFFLAQTAAKAMAGSGGSMIFLSDTAAIKPYGSYLPYCISKAGIDAMVRGLAKSLAPGIRVNAVAPYIVTRPPDLSDQGWCDLLNKTPMRKAATLEEIADLVATLARSETITGQIIAVDGGRLLR